MSGDIADPRRWSGISPAIASDCMGRFGAMVGIRRLSGAEMAGPAFPVETAAGENGTLHRALRVVPAGAVLVVAAAAGEDRAVWGEVLTLAAEQAGIRGVVLDGATRDVDAIRGRDFPLFARATSPAGPHKGWPGRIGEPVACAGVVVSPGDVVLGDGDGVAVVPAADAERVLAAARERAGLEQEWLGRIRAGEPSTRVLGLED